MKIAVTAEHIAKGKRNLACQCPIALAVREAGYAEASVETERIYLDDWWENPAARRLWLPDEAKKFVQAFDEGCPVEPFEFELPTEGP